MRLFVSQMDMCVGFFSLYNYIFRGSFGFVSCVYIDLFFS